MLIRTGGESRISNYLLWQCAYAELYWSDLFWPEFSPEAMNQALGHLCQPTTPLRAIKHHTLSVDEAPRAQLAAI
jgi:hypothetical protein